MARQHGDLSADVPDPVKDWNEKGVTYQAFQYGRPAWDRGGLSSRAISGETLGMCDPALAGKHGVALSLDAKLVPLWRKMCQYADSKIGTEEELTDVAMQQGQGAMNPWRKSNAAAVPSSTSGAPLSDGPRWTR
jgi:hypothetical protein